LKDDAVAALVVNDETRRQYLNLEPVVGALFKSLSPYASAFEFSPICNVFKILAEKIRAEFPVVDISAVRGEVRALVNKSIADDYVTPPISNDPARYVDLSQINFEAPGAIRERPKPSAENFGEIESYLAGARRQADLFYIASTPAAGSWFHRFAVSIDQPQMLLFRQAKSVRGLLTFAQRPRRARHLIGCVGRKTCPH
jgi:hypothetical protein